MKNSFTREATKLKDFGIYVPILLAILSAAAYVVVYLYETIYLSHFGVNSDSVRVTTEAIIASLSSITLAAGFVSYILIKTRKIVDRTSKKNRLFVKIFFILILYSFLYTPLLYVVSPSTFILDAILLFIFTLATATVVSILSVGALNLVKSFNKSLAKRLKLAFRARISSKMLLETDIGLVFLTLIVYVMTIPTITASQETHYKILNYNNQHLIVIREYGDEIIGARINLENNKIINKYYYLNKQELGNVSYEIKKIKPDVDNVAYEEENKSPLLWLSKVSQTIIQKLTE